MLVLACVAYPNCRMMKRVKQDVIMILNCCGAPHTAVVVPTTLNMEEANLEVLQNACIAMTHIQHGVAQMLIHAQHPVSYLFSGSIGWIGLIPSNEKWNGTSWDIVPWNELQLYSPLRWIHRTIQSGLKLT